MCSIKLVIFVISSLTYNAHQSKSFSVFCVRNQVVKLVKTMVTSFYDQWQRFWSII
jgi:hypothetical protein